MPSSNSRRATVLTAAALLAGAFIGPTAARGQVEISTYVGLLQPTGDLLTATTTLSDPGYPFIGPGVSEFSVRWRHALATTLGTRITVALSERVAVEAEVGYAQSDVEQVLGETFSGLTAGGVSLDATLLTLTGRGLLRFPVSAGTTLHVLGGVGLLSRSGRAYEPFEGTVDWALNLGTGVTIQLGERAGLRLDVADYVSWPDLREKPGPALSERREGNTISAGGLLDGETTMEEEMQHYLMFAPSLVIRI